MKKLHVTLAIFSCWLTVSCSYDAFDTSCETLQDDVEISYNVDISPIIRSTCAIQNCHIAGFENGDFTQFDQLKERIETGKMEFMITNREMPPTNSDGPILDICEVKKIRKWIAQGANNN